MLGPAQRRTHAIRHRDARLRLRGKAGTRRHSTVSDSTIVAAASAAAAAVVLHRHHHRQA
jgi:hypothetical protein